MNNETNDIGYQELQILFEDLNSVAKYTRPNILSIIIYHIKRLKSFLKLKSNVI